MENIESVGTVPLEENAGVTEATPVVEETKEAPTEKLFTQAEVDKVVAERLSRETAKLKKAEVVNNENTSSAELNIIKQELAEAKSQLSTYAEQLSLKEYDINKDFIDFVDFEAKKRASANNQSYAEALKGYMSESGSKYLNVAKHDVPKRLENLPADAEVVGMEEAMLKAAGLKR